MQWQFTPYAIPLMVSAVMLTGIAIVAWKQRASRGALPLLWVLISLLFAVTGYAFELGSTSVEDVRFWLKVEYIGLIPLPVALFALILVYTRHPRHLTPLVLVVLLIIPVLTLGFAFTSEHHTLIFHDIQIDRSQGYTATLMEHGSYYWFVHIPYSYLLNLATLIVLAHTFFSATGLYKKQLGMLLAGLAAGWIVNGAYVVGLAPEGLDLTPYGFSLAAAIIALAILQTQLLDLAPIAREIVLTTMQDAVIITDAEHRIIDLNPSACHLIGPAAQNAIGKPASEVFAPWADKLARFQDISEVSTEISLEIQGRMRVFDLQLSTQQDRRGVPQTRVIVLHDITHRIDTQNELRKFSQAVEQSANAILITDPGGTIEYANRIFTHVTGYTRKETIGQTLKDGHIPPGEYETIWDTITQGGEWRGTFQNRRKDGTLYWETTLIQPIVSADGAITHFLAIKEDITRQREAEAALQAAHDRLAILRRVDIELSRKLNLNYVTSIAMDAALRMSMADNGFLMLVDGDQFRIVQAFGEYTKRLETHTFSQNHGIAGRAFRTRKPQFVPDVSTDPDYVAIARDTVAKISIPLIVTDQPIGMLNLEARTPGLFTAEVFESLNLLSAHIATAIANALSYEERERLVRELDAYAHTVAHDLKNPLNVTMGYAAFAGDNVDTMAREQIHTYLMRIENGGKKMLNIINELLLLASVRQLEGIETEPLDMVPVVGGALDRLSLVIEEADATITQPTNDAWPVALGYAPWVEEVWANYISNAIKYGGTPPCVELGATRQENGFIRYWVRDNGPGLTPDQQAKLFTEFTRLDRSRAEGHGLGLSIVQRIIAKLGGHVGVESQVGHGSTFFFTLPPAL